MAGHKRGQTSSERQARARQLRREATHAEALVWHALRNRRLAGVKFRRQHPIGRFIVDFCSPQHRLILEIDGAIHYMQQERDQERMMLLEGAGYTIIRWSNDDVLHNLPTKLTELQQMLQPTLPTPGTDDV